MRDEVYLSKKEYLEILKVLDMMVCILDKSEKRDNADNRAYSLAIACAEMDMASRLTSIRKIVSRLITREEFSELDDLGVFDYEISQMPYDADLPELREQLKPYLVKYEKCLEQ